VIAEEEPAVLGSLGYPEMGVLLLFGLFLFGPERLPGMAKELGKLLRQVRAYGTSVRDELASEMGPEFGNLDLRSLNPKEFVRRHLLEDEPAQWPSIDPAPVGEHAPTAEHAPSDVPTPSEVPAASTDPTATPSPEPTPSPRPPAATEPTSTISLAKPVPVSSGSSAEVVPPTRTRFRDPAGT